jgi:CheY-like chemotaxis protein
LPTTESTAAANRDGVGAGSPGPYFTTKDDDDVVRRVYAQQLRGAGYDVVAVESGTAAFVAYRDALARTERFDVVPMDVVHPRQAARRRRRRDGTPGRREEVLTSRGVGLAAVAR